MNEKKNLNEFSPTHHAILFGYIAKEIISRLIKLKMVEDLNHIFCNELVVEFKQMCNAILNHGKKLLNY